MGHSSYSVSNRTYRAASTGIFTNSLHENFTQTEIKNEMDPKGVVTRESRDSAQHPESVAIIIGVDHTGSMGGVPDHLVKEGIPHIMDKIMQGGVKDPQVLFMGIGDHETDQAPLQIGQFESGDEDLDKWLMSLFLEGNGGGNLGESYLLAWYFAAFHTSIDCFEKRGKKGFLFTIGDEPTLPTLPNDAISKIMGGNQHGDLTHTQLLEEVSKTYNVYHIHIKETREGSGRGRMQNTVGGWQQLLGDNLIVAEKHEEVSRIISRVVTGNYVSTPQQAMVDGDSQQSSPPVDML